MGKFEFNAGVSAEGLRCVLDSGSHIFSRQARIGGNDLLRKELDTHASAADARP
jgi:hypothetical protein